MCAPGTELGVVSYARLARYIKKVGRRAIGLGISPAEFRYVDLGRTGVACAPGADTICTEFSYRGEFSNTLMLGLVGLAYKF